MRFKPLIKVQQGLRVHSYAYRPRQDSMAKDQSWEKLAKMTINIEVKAKKLENLSLISLSAKQISIACKIVVLFIFLVQNSLILDARIEKKLYKTIFFILDGQSNSKTLIISNMESIIQLLLIFQASLYLTLSIKLYLTNKG